MNGLEICLVIIGLIFVACSFLFSEHLASGDDRDDTAAINVSGVTEEIVKREVEAEVANIIDDRLDEMEIKIEKMTSEKLMAMGEFSEDIQKRISQNHEEVMFLYNMLNDKEEVLKNTIRDIEAVKASVKKMAIVNDVARDMSEEQNKSIKSDTKQQTNELSKDISNISTDENVDIDSVNIIEIDKTGTQAQELVKTAESKNVKEKNERKREISNNNQMILKLYSQGKSNIEIAKQLGLGIGEVRLVIDLFNTK